MYKEKKKGKEKGGGGGHKERLNVTLEVGSAASDLQSEWGAEVAALLYGSFRVVASRSQPGRLLFFNYFPSLSGRDGFRGQKVIDPCYAKVT